MKSYLSGLIVPLTPSTRPTNVEHLARKEEQPVGYPFKIWYLRPPLTPTDKEHLARKEEQSVGYHISLRFCLCHHT